MQCIENIKSIGVRLTQLNNERLKNLYAMQCIKYLKSINRVNIKG